MFTCRLDCAGEVPKAPDPAGVLFSGDPQTLRKAILDLSQTFKDRYARAGEFLAQLGALEKRLQDPKQRAAAQADFEALQRRALAANPLVSGQPVVFVRAPPVQPGPP